MHRTVALLLFLSALPLAAADEPTQLSYAPHVMLQVDASPELKRKISLYLKRSLEFAGAKVEDRAEWKILVVAFEPDGKEDNPRRFSMASSYIQRLQWLDPQLLAAIEKTPCPPPALIKQYADRVLVMERFVSMQSSEGKVSDLQKTCEEIARNFIRVCAQPQQEIQKEAGSLPMAKAP